MGNSEAGNTINNDHAEAAYQALVDQGLDKEWQVVVAHPRQLMIDIDGNDLPETFGRLLSILQAQVGTVEYKVTLSKGGNRHLIIDMPKTMDILERVAWQAIFGSDPVREAAHLRSIQKQELNPILLFERKVAGQLTAAPERPLLGDAVAENEPQILKEFVEVVLDLRRKYEALLATTRQGD